MSASIRDRRVCARLLAAAAAGALLASCHEEGSSLRKATPPADVVAVVNGRAITRDAFARYAGSTAGAADDAALDVETRRRLLLQMVDEELLLQRGIALDLHRRDPAARRAILSAVIASVTGGEVAEPDDATLRAYYEENTGRFGGPERLAFERVRGEVRIAYLRQRRERALRDTLEALHRDADVRVLDRDLLTP